MFIKALLPLSFVFISLSILAQDFDQKKMDAFFDAIEENDKGMGSFALSKGGEVIYARAIGYANVSKKQKPNPETKYRIGSISKTFTATIIMQLQEEGKIDLSDKLASYFEIIPNAKDITIDQMLSHRSGIFNFTNAQDFPSIMTRPMSREQLLEKIAYYEPSFSPGKKYEYSNSNYVLLSMIIESVEKKTFQQVLKERIVEKCTLKDTYYGGKINSNKNEAFSYIKIDKWKAFPESDLSIPLGAGGIVSTPTDLNQFFYGLFSGKLISEESLKKMTTLRDNYGYGLISAPFYEKTAFGHNGKIDNFLSSSLHFQAENVTISYLSNGADMVPNDILIGALSIYFGRDYEIPSFKALYEIKNSNELDPYLGKYYSDNFPLNITITKRGNTLIAQASGQPSFPLEPTDRSKFQFSPANIEMIFEPSEKKLIFTQNANTFTFFLLEP